MHGSGADPELVGRTMRTKETMETNQEKKKKERDESIKSDSLHHHAATLFLLPARHPTHDFLMGFVLTGIVRRQFVSSNPLAFEEPEFPCFDHTWEAHFAVLARSTVVSIGRVPPTSTRNGRRRSSRLGWSRRMPRRHWMWHSTSWLDLAVRYLICWLSGGKEGRRALGGRCFAESLNMRW